MEKPKTKVTFHSREPEGNIYYVLGKVSIALRKESRIIEFNDLRDELYESKSYAEALAKIREHVDLIDLDGDV